MGNFRAFTSILIAQLSGLITATCLTWSSPMLVKLAGTDDNPLGRPITSGENSFLAAAPTLGACFGSSLCGLFVSKWGRKTILIDAIVISLIFNLIMAYATNIWFLNISRLMTGFSLGVVFPVLPMYGGEMARVNNRGIVGASMTIFVTVGVFIPFFLGFICSFFWFHILIVSLAAIFIPLSLIFVLESPHYLIDRDATRARQILRKIRASDVEVQEVIDAIRKGALCVPEGTLADCFRNRGVRKGMIIGFGTATFMQLTGNGVILAYSQRIFEEAGSIISPNLCPMLLAIAQLLTTLLITPVYDLFPRKFLLIISYIGVVLSEIPLGLKLYLSERDGDEIKPDSYVPIICLVFNAIAYNLGVGNMNSTILSEIFPTSVKGKAIPLLVLYTWISAFVLTYLFNTITDTLGLGMTFWLFSGCSLVGAIFVKVYVVETKGRTFEEIQEKMNE